MKKFKHKVVEKMRDSTADTLGITRAVLVNGMYPSCSINHIVKCELILYNYINISLDNFSFSKGMTF